MDGEDELQQVQYCPLVEVKDTFVERSVKYKHTHVRIEELALS